MRLGKYGVAYDLYFGLLTYGTDDYKGTPTLNAGDIAVDIDGAGFQNVAVLGAETAAGSKLIKQSLSIGEMTGKKITIRIVDQTATKEWSDDMYIIYTFGNANAQLVFDLSVATQAVNLSQIFGTALTETSSGYLAAAFKKLFDVSTPVMVASSLPAVAGNKMDFIDAPNATAITAINAALAGANVVDTGFNVLTALKEILAKNSGGVAKTGDAYAFKNRAGATLFTLTITGDNVVRS